MSVVKMQSCIRRYLAKTQVAMMKAAKARAIYESRSRATLTLQAHWRGFVARRKYQRSKAAAIVLQSHFRGLRARTEYRRAAISVIKIQTYVRRFLAKNLVTNLRIARKEALLAAQTKAAIVIQSQYRMILARRELAELKQLRAQWELWATVTIQCWFRRHLAQKQLKSLKARNQAALEIQTFWKAYRARKNYLSLQQATVTIQKHFRGHRARLIYSNAIRSIVKVQCFVRRYLAKVQLLQRKAQRDREILKAKTRASVIIQTNYRRILAQRTLAILKLQRAQRRNWAALQIQCMFRCYSAKKELSKLKLRSKSATLIQCQWRGYRARKSYRNCKVSAIAIQSFFRMYLAKKELAGLKQAFYEKQRIAATRIQSQFRCFIARKYFLRKKWAAIVIQSNFRQIMAFRQMTQLRVEKNLREFAAAVMIQKTWRQFAAQMHYQRTVQSVLKIQSCVRRYIAKARLRAYEEQRIAATRIQSQFRCFVARKHFLHKKWAAIAIQSNFRQIMAVRQLNQLRAEKNLREFTAAVMIQKAWRRYTAQMHYQRIVQSVLKIQSYVRRYIAKARLCVLKQERVELRNRSATLIQSSWRCHLAREKYLRVQNSVLMIQKVFRGFCERKKYLASIKSVIVVQCCVRRFLSKCLLTRLRDQRLREIFETKTKAATQIQCFFRRTVAQRRLAQLKLAHGTKRELAALCIQCAWRGHRAKVQLNVLKQVKLEKETKAAIEIQKTWRCYRDTQRYRLILARIVKCQSVARMYLASRRVAKLKLERAASIRKKREESALLIQAAWKRYVAQTSYAKTRRSVVTIQRMVRGYQARVSYGKTLVCVVKAQCCVRRFLALRLLKNLREKKAADQQRAAIKIQCHFRMLMAQKKLRHLKKAHAKKLYRAALVIQCSYRCFTARQKLNTLRLRNNSAIRIQSLWRGFQARLTYTRSVAAAITIQKTWKAHQARANYLETKAKIVQAQSLVKRYLAIREFKLRRARRAEEVFRLQTRSATLIQNWYRVHLAKRKLANLKVHHMEKINRAATTIQAEFRCWTACKNYRKQIRAIITIQSHARRLAARTELSNLRLKRKTLENHSAVQIQKTWRAYSERMAYKSFVSSVVLTQSCVRRFLAKRKMSSLRIERARAIFEERTQAAVIIQSRWKRILAERTFNQVKNASITIQKWTRMYQARSVYKRMIASIVKTQCCVRKFLARKKLAGLRYKRALEVHEARVQAALILQKNWKTRQAKLNYAKTRVSIIKTQSYVRMFLARKFVMAMRIQKHRRIFELRTKSTITIQNFWRMVLAKRRLEWLKLRHIEKVNGAAIAIQCGFRRYLARKLMLALKEERRVRQNTAAVKIQKNYRAYRARQLYRQTLSSVVKVQSCIRRFLSVRTAAKMRAVQARILLETQNRAAVLIQCQFRRFLARKLMLQLKEEARARQYMAAVRIQKTYRRYRVRLLYQKTLRSIVMVQSCVRRFLSIKIVSAMRAEKAKLLVESQTRAATVIQSHWRGKSARNLFTILKFERIRRQEWLLKVESSVVLIQTAVRCFLAKIAAKKRIKNIKKLQTVWRAMIVRKQFLKKRNSAIVIQKFFRGYRLREVFRKAQLLVSSKSYYPIYMVLLYFRL